MDQPAAAEHIELGRTGIRISPLGIGAWQWGDRMMWDYGKGGYNDDDIEEGFLASLEQEINFFDTAEVYGMGRSETLLGQFLKNHPAPVVAATKFFPFPFRLSKGSLLRALKSSLQRLGLPCVDLYQIHQPIPPRSPEHWAEALAEAYQMGLVKAVGVSNYSADWMRRADDTLARRGIPLASNQVEYSLFNRHVEHNGVQKACQERNITLIAYSPLAKGMLSGKYSVKNPPPSARRAIYGKYLAEITRLVEVLREVGEAHGGKQPAQVALRWLMEKGAVPIPGIKNAAQARSNAGALGWKLSMEEVAKLDATSSKINR